jgi:biopolymer transport protein ExbD
MPVIKKRAVKKARIEIIPLIDVIFFLLATFVLFTLSLDRIAAITIDLPKAVPPDPTKEPPPVVTVQVSDQGTLYWNKEIINKDILQSRLEDYASTESDPRVLIAGDDKAKYGPTIEVLDAVRAAKIEQVSIETRVRPTGR